MVFLFCRTNCKEKDFEPKNRSFESLKMVHKHLKEDHRISKRCLRHGGDTIWKIWDMGVSGQRFDGLSFIHPEQPHCIPYMNEDIWKSSFKWSLNHVNLIFLQ